MGSVTLVTTSARLAPGVLSWPAWEALRRYPVYAALPTDALQPAGVPVTPATPAELLAAARAADVAWLAGPDDDPALADLLADAGVAVRVVEGAPEPPGARLLDVVATMDRLRSPGGCPWDAEQTHASLAPYLLEEAYEAFQAIEDADDAALREELGDVLLQVVFHARVAAERGAAGWTVDDVAAGLVDKLVRRHPHVFADTSVTGAAEVSRNWDVIKAAEKQRSSVTDGVPLAAPALTLAWTLQRRSAKLGTPAGLVSPELARAETAGQAVAGAAAVAEERGGVDAVGDLLWAVVALARSLDVDPEAALRGRARAFRDALAAVERAAREAGLDPAQLDARQWETRWPATS